MGDVAELIKFMKEQEVKREQERADERQQREVERQQREADRVEMAKQQTLIQQLLAREISALQVVPGADNQQFNNLKDQMNTFVYDSVKNLTFENWFARYESIFTTQIEN